MSLLVHIEARFFPRIRARGQDHVRSGRVRVEADTPDLVLSTVHGREDHHVALERRGHTLLAGCTCPHASSWGIPCKHIWAVALTSQEQGLLQGDGSPLRDFRLISPAAAASERDAGRFEELVPPGRAHPLVRRLGLATPAPPPIGMLDYRLDLELSLANDLVIVRAGVGTDRPRPLHLPASGIGDVIDPLDRTILAIVLADVATRAGEDERNPEMTPSLWRLSRTLCDVLLPPLCRTGRFLLRTDRPLTPARALSWDARRWEFGLRLEPSPEGRWLLTGCLRRGEDRVPLEDAEVLAQGGIVLIEDRLSPFDDRGGRDWRTLLQASPRVLIGEEQVGNLVAGLLSDERLPQVDLPDQWRLDRQAVAPRPRLRLTMGEPPCRHIHARLSFVYDGHIVDYPAPRDDIVDLARRRLITRDLGQEQAARRRLSGLRLRHCRRACQRPSTWRLAARRLGPAVRALVREKWVVEAEGELYRPPSAWSSGITSGVDWFELRASVAFDDEVVPLPEILKALRRGESYVRLGDGSFGLLPEEWLSCFMPMADLAQEHEDHVRFRPSQAALLDALLAARPETSFDDGFQAARGRLSAFTAPQPLEPSGSFRGELRGYQKDGLGWMQFLSRLGFGGCLADDMGLGKTIQILAMLDRRREEGLVRRPTLIVVPRSLVFNWKQEAARFTPHLNLVDHAGQGRSKDASRFAAGTFILTTYGAMRRDIGWLKDVPFDHVILDEAQAIKNFSSQSAKAARLLQADHRLALSGTPIENHLGELWSLFEFLNPGLLGASRLLGRLAEKSPSDGTTELIAQAIRPFVLRRTKAQVAPELPERSEQTLVCVLEGEQRRIYDELKEYYRTTLLQLKDAEGLGQQGMLVIEALLRLRQAACHPGLLDAARKDDPSAKLDMMMPRLLELMQEGHKALVFSQFTSFLALLRRRLDARGLRYAYLDGQTIDRASVVERFQRDPALGLFLISLKAGGLGLNLTAADYVFLLDPWWNPAVEAQAIDRAHRIGQRRQVMAYRLVARDTVEERILELQRRKRALADSIIRADSRMLANLTREDLEVLLS